MDHYQPPEQPPKDRRTKEEVAASEHDLRVRLSECRSWNRTLCQALEAAGLAVPPSPSQHAAAEGRR